MQSSSRNGAKVVWLCVHTTEGIMRAIDLRNWASWTGSSHASSDETGALLTPADGFVPYDQAAWTLRNGNPISENIEQCGWARWTRVEWLTRPLLLDATARWLADRSRARGIPLVRLSDADIRARRPGVIGHGDYSRATGDGTHTDPGPNYPWDVVLDKARAYAAGRNPEDDMTPDEHAALIAIRDEILKKLPSRAYKGAPGTDTVLGYAANADGFGWRIENRLLPAMQQQIVGLQAAVNKLASAVGGDDLTADELKAAIKEAIAESVVDVNVNVGPKPAA